MPTTITAFEVVCTVGSSFLSGSMLNMDVGPAPVTAIRWRVPPGPQGHLEWWLAQSGVPVFPNANGRGVIADNEWDTWSLDAPPSNTIWQLYCINSGTLDHVVELQFYQDYGGGGGTGIIDLTAIFPQNDSEVAGMFLA
jgi:hypothetical protein